MFPKRHGTLLHHSGRWTLIPSLCGVADRRVVSVYLSTLFYPLTFFTASLTCLLPKGREKQTRPDTRPIPVADGWAGAEMRIFTLSNSITTDQPINQPTDRPTDQRTDKASYGVASPRLKTPLSVSRIVPLVSFLPKEPHDHVRGLEVRTSSSN